MTRINIIGVSQLSDQHLIAEYREITMVPAALMRTLKSNIGLVLSAVSSTSKSVYVGGIIRETGTARAADAIDIRLGIVKD